jgi:hypothetical protein
LNNGGKTLSGSSAGLARGGRVLGQLAVALGERRLRARGDVAVDPLAGVDDRADARERGGVEHVGDGDQHARAPFKAVTARLRNCRRG